MAGVAPRRVRHVDTFDVDERAVARSDQRLRPFHPTADVVIIQGFKEYCALDFFQGALLKDPKKLLVQLGQVQAARVMKFTSAK